MSRWRQVSCWPEIRLERVAVACEPPGMSTSGASRPQTRMRSSCELIQKVSPSTTRVTRPVKVSGAAGFARPGATREVGVARTGGERDDEDSCSDALDAQAAPVSSAALVGGASHMSGVTSADQVAAAALPARHLVVLGGDVEALDAEVAALGDARDAAVVVAPFFGHRLVLRIGLRHRDAARAEPIDQRLGLEHGRPPRLQRRPDASKHDITPPTPAGVWAIGARQASRRRRQG